MAPNANTASENTEIISSNLEGNKRYKKEILYSGEYYDVTDFISKHPGGSIIKFYLNPNEDATLAITEFHNRSIKRVKGILSSFKRRPAPLNGTQKDERMNSETIRRHGELTDDFLQLHKQLEIEGYFKPSISHLFLRTVELLMYFIISQHLNQSENWWGKAGAILFGALFAGRCGWMMHEAGHHSLTGISTVDRALCSFFMGFGQSLSASWWISQHNRHHAMPQRLQHDVDLSTLPLIAYNKKVVQKPEDGQNFFVQHQSKLFFLDILLVQIFWKLYLGPLHAYRKRAYLDITFIILHIYAFSGWNLFNYIIMIWLSTAYLFFNFTLSHTHLPVTDESLHWVEYCLYHTADIQPSWWCDWWMGYLNYQIEHHLFPTMPQYKQRRITHRIKALADKHNIPYQSLAYTDAVKKVFKNLKHVSEELKNMT